MMPQSSQISHLASIQIGQHALLLADDRAKLMLKFLNIKLFSKKHSVISWKDYSETLGENYKTQNSVHSMLTWCKNKKI